MATIEKRKLDDGTISYRVKIRLKGHAPENATFSRLTDAREWVQKTEAEIKAGRHFGASKRHTLNELIDSYESSPRHKDFQSSALPTELLGHTETRIIAGSSHHVNAHCALKSKRGVSLIPARLSRPPV